MKGMVHRNKGKFSCKCQDNQEQVIVMGDWNSNCAEEVVQWKKAIGLKDFIHDRHHDAPPPTCKHSRAYPIDAIYLFQTPSLAGEVAICNLIT